MRCMFHVFCLRFLVLVGLGLYMLCAIGWHLVGHLVVCV